MFKANLWTSNRAPGRLLFRGQPATACVSAAMRIFWAFALPSASCLSCATVAGGQKCSLLVRHSRKTAATLSNEHLTVAKISTKGDSDIPMAVRTVEADAIAALASDGKSLGELRSSRGFARGH